MAVTFILGRAGAGKTRACLDAVLAELARAGDTRRLILLVPEQASFQMERSLATRAPGHGFSRAAVQSFSRLAHRVLAETPITRQILGPEARSLALRRVVAEAAPRLGTLRDASGTAGFFVELDRFIEELLSENVPPAVLLAAAGRLDDPAAARKTRELAKLYTDYLDWLGPKRIDAAARLELLREQLPGLPWLHEARVWVDGFAGFTGQELDTLVALARRAPAVTVTLLLDPAAASVQSPRTRPDPLSLFSRTETTYQRLMSMFAAAGVAVGPAIVLQPPIMPRFSEVPVLAALESSLAGGYRETHQPTTAGRGAGRYTAAPAATPLPVREGPGEGKDVRWSGVTIATKDAGWSDRVALVECATHREELRAAARWIRTLLAESGGKLRFRDFAVITRDLEPLADTIAEVFAEYEIPHFLDRRRSMRAHPLARLVPIMLEVLTGDFEIAAAVRLLRTGLLPLSRDQAQRLENLVVQHAIRGRSLWQQAEWNLEPGKAACQSFPDQRQRLLMALEPLSVLTADRAARDGGTWARAIYHTLTALDVPRLLGDWIAAARQSQRWDDAEMHRLAWEALCGVLENLHDVLGDTRLTPGEVSALVGSTLSQRTLGLAPPTVDQVLVSAVERSRHPDIRHAWVFAFNEGVFPARPGEDLLLGAAERESLAAAGLPAPASRREDIFAERLLAYIALTRPSASLVISYARVGDNGDALAPSSLLPDVRRALPGLTPTRLPDHPPPVCLEELARGLLLAAGDENRPCLSQRYEVLRARLPAGDRLSWLLRGRDYANSPAATGNFRRPADAGGDVVWRCSPSEVETYVQCPFQHFARFGLRLDPSRAPRPLRWDLGTHAHRILADVTRRGMREPGGARGVTPQRWSELLDDTLDDHWRRQPPDLAQRRPDLAALTGVLAGFLRELIAVNAARWERGRFEPLYCEQAFDPQDPDALPALVLNLPDGRPVHVFGRIDRIDICRDAQPPLLLIYDYKSSAETLRSPFLTGKRLQLMLYLAAARQARATEQPAGVLLAPLYPDTEVFDKPSVVGTEAAEQLMRAYRPRGLFTDGAGRALDTQRSEGASPVAHMRLKKDGGFYSGDDAVPSDQVGTRIDLAERSVLAAATGVARGVIDVAPLVERNRLACKTCDFADVCRFDRAYNRPRAAETALPRLDADDGEDAE